MGITYGDLGVPEDLGRRILMRARIIAPCIDSLEEDSEDFKNAVAVLKGVIEELPEAGSRRARSLSRNGTSITFTDIDSAFDTDARESLRSICAARSAVATPRGSFPEARPISRIWPEGPYS